MPIPTTPVCFCLYRRLVAVCLLAWLAAGGGQAQDANFSQFYAAPLYLNPALAGVEKDVTVAVGYRSQWRSLGFPQQIGQVSGIVPLGSRRNPLLQAGGLGLAAYHDVSGEGNNFRVTGIQAGAACNLALSADFRHVLSFGMQVGLIQKTVDFSDLRWGSQYNAAAPFFGFDHTAVPLFASGDTRNTRLLPVVHSGVVWHFQSGSLLAPGRWRGFLGASAANINRPDESLLRGAASRMPVLYRAQGGLEIEISPGVHLLPNLLWMQQRGRRQLNAGTYVAYALGDARRPGRVMAGGWYRFGDSVALMAGFAKAAYTLGVSYDVNTSSLRYASRGRGAWELSLTYRVVKNHGARRFATPLL